MDNFWGCESVDPPGVIQVKDNIKPPQPPVIFDPGRNYSPLQVTCPPPCGVTCHCRMYEFSRVPLLVMGTEFFLS